MRHRIIVKGRYLMRRPKPRVPLEAQLAQMREVWRINHPGASEAETQAAFAQIARKIGI